MYINVYVCISVCINRYFWHPDKYIVCLGKKMNKEKTLISKNRGSKIKLDSTCKRGRLSHWASQVLN